MMVEPKRSEPCLCGSGRKYRDCCRGHLPGFNIGKGYIPAVEAGRLPIALRHARSDVTQYRIWHNTHTRPAMRMGAPIKSLLDVDIAALAEYIERLNWLYYRMRPLDNWLSMLQFLNESIDDKRWRRKTVYFRAMAINVKDGSQAARAEFRRLGQISLDETDVEILHLKCELELHELSFGDRIALLDRIIELSSVSAERLQYRVAKALQYFLVGDTQTATTLVDAALIDGKSEDDEDERVFYRLTAARARHVLALLRNSKDMNSNAISDWREVLSRGGWTSTGKAAILREIADAHKTFREWTQAEAVYREAASLENSQIANVMLAECLIGQSRYTEAEQLLRGVDISKFDIANTLDLAFTNTDLALQTGDPASLDNAKSLLEQVHGVEPYFEQRRLRLLLAVAERRTSEAAVVVEKSALERLNEMLILKPALFGIGLNINSVIDQVIKQRAKKPKQQASRRAPQK